jgi:glyoxylase-like metal-dependent hydrolase (beta-lactamase superfamily II)
MTIDTIDLNFQGVPGVIAAYLVRSEGEVALVETGPGISLKALCEGILAHGIDFESVTKVFVTHVHLDHAGGAGWWANRGAQIFCHPRAARHLIDPGRLIESARKVYGDAFDSLFGGMDAAPIERVTVMNDGDIVNMGGERVSAIETLGHARHHHAFAVGDVCFTGDVAGVKLQGAEYLSVAAAPPQFELQPYLESVKKLRNLRFKRLFLTHFGEIDEPEQHLARYEKRIREVADAAKRSLTGGESDVEWRAQFDERERAFAKLSLDSEMCWDRYQVVNSTAMCADGLRIWADTQGV